MNTSETISKLRQVKPYLQHEYAVKSLGLFGSLVDGTYTDDSDVDLLVEFEHPIGWRFFTLEKFLEHTLGRKIDLVTATALKSQIKSSILNRVQYII
jgi:predicted nucleotidyltransferase